MSLAPPMTLAEFDAFMAANMPAGVAEAIRRLRGGRGSAALGVPGPDSAEAAGRGRRLVRWLRRLDRIGIDLIVALKAVLRRPGGENAADTGLAWELILRAYHWAQALQARLAAEAPRAEPLERDEQLFDRPDWVDWQKDDDRAVPMPGLKLASYDVIAGRTDAEVVAHVCADLTTAATLLGESEAAREIAKIARAAHALLGGPAPGTVSSLPIQRAWNPAQITAAKAKLQADRTRPPAPDSG